MDLVVIEAPDMRSAEILDGTRLVGRCPDPNLARHTARLLEKGDVEPARRPKGAATVSTFEHEDGRTDVVVGMTIAVTCPDRTTAEQLALLLESDEGERERPRAWPYGVSGGATREVAS